MKRTSILLAAALMLAASTTAHAQLSSSVSTLKHDSTFAQGRDFWFAMQSNYWGIDLGGKYMRIYITSDQNCTAFVASQYVGGVAGAITPIPVTAYEISSYKIPEFWEMESSGIAENKVIHVYSNTADLAVYDLSHNPYTSDGSYIIPTIGWGTDYVVAAYGSLFEGGGSYGFDLPSTMMVVANQDSTVFSFTPPCDCRSSTSGNDAGDPNSTIIVFFADSTYTFTLNRGQCMEFMPVKSEADTGFDMTGTIIHANKPVGVEGGSVCPNIPADYPYCDHVEEMIPPIRTWDETYYATSPVQPPGETQKDAAMYLFISSQPGQTILRQTCDSSLRTECIIPKQFGVFWDELSLGQKFTSTAPFLVVQYLNGATYPDGNNGLGDPAEVVIPSRDQFTKNVVFETPLSVGNIVPYDDYAQIICRVDDAKNVLFDHKGILGFGAVCIDDTFEIFNIPHIAPSVHEVTSDSGVGVYIYGYGYDETYAWGSTEQCKSFQSPDTAAPLATISTECLESFIHLSDTGALASKLDMIRLDSVYNMNFETDLNWVEGSETDTSGYSMTVVNPSKPGILIVSVFDCAGNHTTIRSAYTPIIDSMKPPLQNLGTWLSGPANIRFDTLYNTGQAVFDISELHLLKGNVGFSLFDSIGGPLDLSPLQPGERRLIKITFEAIETIPEFDSIIYGNSCWERSVALIGSGGQANFFVTSQSWPNAVLTQPPTCYPKTVTIFNFSTDTLTIDKAFWKDAFHFHAVSTFPITIPPAPASAQFTIEYCPDSNSLMTPDGTEGSWTSPDVLEGLTEVPHFDSLTGSAVAPSETFTQSIDTTFDCVLASETATSAFTITATGTAPSTIARIAQYDSINFFNLTGTLDNGVSWNPVTTAQTLTPGQTALISVNYIVPDSNNVGFGDNFIAIDGFGDTIGGGPLFLTVNVNFNAGTLNPPSQTFVLPGFQVNNPALTTSSVALQNTARNAPLIVDTIALQELNQYNPAFTFSLPAGVTFPDTLPVGGTLPLTLDFNDSLFDVVKQQTQLIFTTNACAQISETLTAIVAGAGVKETIIPSLDATILPTDDGRALQIILPTNISGSVNFLLVNVLGESVLRSTFGVGTENIDASSLPRGVYFYRLTSGQMSQSGKVILGE